MMGSWLYSGVWFIIFCGISYLVQPRTYSVKGKVVFGGILILHGVVFVLTYITLFSAMRVEALITLIGGVAVGLTVADIRTLHTEGRIARQLLDQPEYQTRLKQTTHHKDILHIVLDAEIQATRIIQAETTHCTQCGKEFLEQERYVIEEMQYCSDCAQKKTAFHTHMYYGLIGVCIVLEIGLALGVYSDVQRGFPFKWGNLNILLYPLITMIPVILFIRGIITRNIEKISFTLGHETERIHPHFKEEQE